MDGQAAPGTAEAASDVRLLRLRYPGTCAGCHGSLPAGTIASWDRIGRTVRCIPCSPADEGRSALDFGTAGRSARMEHQRRAERRRASLEDRWGAGMVGRLAKAVSTEPVTTRA